MAGTATMPVNPEVPQSLDLAENSSFIFFRYVTLAAPFCFRTFASGR
jgi:hypothetical protein